MKGDFFLAVQDFRIGLPGMLVQIAGGWLFINRSFPQPHTNSAPQ